MTTRLAHCILCEKRVKCRQLCSAHYYQAYREGNLPPREDLTICKVCGGRAVARDMCDAHYHQFRRKVLNRGNKISAGPCSDGLNHSWGGGDVCRICGVDRPEGWT